MSHTLNIAAHLGKEERYKALLPQIHALVSGEPDQIANLANIAAALKEAFGFWWVGFYLVKGNELVLGPFQGPVACTRIAFGKGVCGMAWAERRAQVVPNVDLFPGHIACSSQSQSEIVLPLFRGAEIVGVLDIDSDKLADFDHIDHQYLALMLSGLDL